MNKTITFANEDGLTRLQAVERYQKGETLAAIAQDFKVHYTTVAEWVKMYQEGGVERLNTYRKPRPSYELNKIQLENSLLDAATEKEKKTLSALLDLSITGKLNETAQKHGVTAQALAKWRRLYLQAATSPIRKLPYKAIKEIETYEAIKRKLEAGEYTRLQDQTKARRRMLKIEKRLPQLQEVAKNYNPNMARWKNIRRIEKERFS